MRFFNARRLALAAFLPVLFSFTLIPGCSKQGEGDRCGDDFGLLDDSDCDDGLVCTTIDAHIYRCCNPTRTTNARCIKVTASAAGGGAGIGVGGGAGANPGAGESNVSDGGSGATNPGAGVAGDSSPATEAGAGGS